MNELEGHAWEPSPPPCLSSPPRAVLTLGRWSRFLNRAGLWLGLRTVSQTGPFRESYLGQGSVYLACHLEASRRWGGNISGIRQSMGPVSLLPDSTGHGMRPWRAAASHALVMTTVPG